MNLSISNFKARRFLLKKQLLLQPRTLQGDEAIDTVFNKLRLIQYDPLNPCGRNVDLVLQARIEKYHPNAYYKWLYEQKKGIECYDKELCILPLKDFPLSRVRQGRSQKEQENKKFLKKYQRQIEQLLMMIERNGPVSSAAITDTTKVMSGWGTEALFGRMALEMLWKMGRLTVVKRENGKKYYDIPSKVHSALGEENTTHYLLTKEHLLRRLGSVGLLPLSGSGGGWQGLGSVKEVKVLLQQLLEKEEIIGVSVENCSRTYVALCSDVDKLDEVASGEDDKKVVFLAPLDNLMWDREMVHDLFQFYYRWEVYTPINKRAYGYYVLPILYGDTFIGRIEPVLGKDNMLHIKGFWQEDKRKWDKKVWQAFEEGLDMFKSYLKADGVVDSPLYARV